jgi:hypothetical protein
MDARWDGLRLLVLPGWLDLGGLQIVGVTAAFFAIEIPLARWTHRLGLRERPYRHVVAGTGHGHAPACVHQAETAPQAGCG